MKNCVKGLAASGSWVMFDHADKLSESNLAFLAQQIEYLSNAVKHLFDTKKDFEYDPHAVERVI
jgi:hypothetical protein